MWRLTTREDGRKAKVPVSPATGQRIDPLAPGNWRGFDDALRELERGHTDGIAFVLTEKDPYCGVDLDDVLEPETGEIAPWASEVIEGS